MTIMMLLSLWRFLLPGTAVTPSAGPPAGSTPAISRASPSSRALPRALARLPVRAPRGRRASVRANARSGFPMEAAARLDNSSSHGSKRRTQGFRAELSAEMPFRDSSGSAERRGRRRTGRRWTTSPAPYGLPESPADGYADASIARLFEMTSDLLATISHEGRFTLLNPAWEKVLGWTREELRAAPIEEFLHPDDLEQTAEIMQCRRERGRADLHQPLPPPRR